MRNDIVNLIAKVVNGSTVTEKQTQVFAEKKSVKRSEFYAAYSTGLNPRYVFLVDLLDFESAASGTNEVAEIMYNGKTYNILRTYETDTGEIELTVG